MKVKYRPIDKTKPSYTVLAKEIPTMGKPFKYTTISKDSKILDKWSKIVIGITIIGTDAYRVETEDSIYNILVE